uniref:Uncharacterized protein n=1 Tax=Cannabis sativa TaxID=3483 RepID=A0A803PW23_CANSA
MCLKERKFSCVPPSRLLDGKSCSTSIDSSRIGAWRIEHIKAGVVLPLRQYFKDFWWKCPTPFEIMCFYALKACSARSNYLGGFYYLDTHSNDHKIIVRLPNKKEFKHDFFWTTRLHPINTTQFRILHASKRPVPTPVIQRRHKIFMNLPLWLVSDRLPSS